MPENWDSVKKLISKDERMKDLYTIEAEYLEEHPDSGYLTEIMGLKSFPDYLDYLPAGAIQRKIGVMGYYPQNEAGGYPFVAMSREEYSSFLETAANKVIQGITRGVTPGGGAAAIPLRRMEDTPITGRTRDSSSRRT